MTLIRKVALACVAASMMTLSVNAGAQGPANQDTFFTFSQPVELPNKTLPAGTYFFQLMDSSSNRHIVKVMSQDRKELHATLMAIPFYSNERPSDEPQVRFMETPAAASGTNAIKIWFYPGTSTGHEFIYPRSQAARLAQRSVEPVLTTKADTEIADSVSDADLTRVDRTGADAAVSTEAAASTVPAEPAPQREQIGGLAPPTTTPARDELPATASMLPLLALIGAGSLVGSQMLRRARK